MKLPTAVVVGMEANGLAVSRALSAYKIPCIGLAGPQWSPSCQTNTCQVMYSKSWCQEEIVADLRTIGERFEEKAALLITKDEPVLWVSECRDELSQFYHINLPPDDVVNLLMSKTRFLDMAKNQGWPIPLTWTINSEDELLNVLGAFTFPCILKPRIKNSEFRKRSPRKAFKIHGRDELTRTYRMVAQWEPQVVIQEWIEGGDEQIAFCLSYCDRHGNPTTMFPGRKLLQWPLECGNTVISEPVNDVKLARSLMELTSRIWTTVSFAGLGSIEYKIRMDTNELVIMEPTVGRTNYQSELAVINGCNIPVMAYADLVGIPPLDVIRRGPPVKLVDGAAEGRAIVASYRAGRLAIGQWLKHRRGKKKYAILRANDLGPFITSLAVMIGIAISRSILRLCGPGIRSRARTIVFGLAKRLSGTIVLHGNVEPSSLRLEAANKNEESRQ